MTDARNLTAQQTRNLLIRGLEKVSDRWHDAGTDRKRLNAARAAVAYLAEAYYRHQWVIARPDSSESTRWADRLAACEGRPRSLPRPGCHIYWSATEDATAVRWTA